MLAAAFAFQYLGGLDPCVLCVYQRWPHAAAVAIGVVALVSARKSAPVAVALVAVAAALAASAGLAAYHVGVEQGWVEASAACTGSLADTADSIEALRRQILAASTARCDEPAWTFAGISMAGWNLLLSAVLAAAALTGALTTARNRSGEDR